jgi:nucleoside-diphosphate-sugar epimerase
MTPPDDRRQPPELERFLVTGAYGCIGAWTVRQLVREGVEVIGVDAGDDDHRVRELNMAAASASSKGPVWPL